MPEPIFVFKVALDSRKRIWRRIALRGRQTLDDLHEAIYSAFDRDDEHLYSFYFPPPGSRGRARFRGAVEYTHPDNAGDPGPFGDEPLPSAGKVRIAALGLQPDMKFLYLFDFGDMWLHEITVEQTGAADDGGKYPRVMELYWFSLNRAQGQFG